MKVNYSIDMEDFMSFQRYYFSSSKNFFKLKLLNSLILPFFLLIVISILSYLKGVNITILVISILGVIMVFLIRYKTFTRDYLNQIKKEYEKTDTKNIIGDIIMETNDDYFNLTLNGNEEKIKWQSLTKIALNKDYFYFFTSEFGAHILPKNKISNIEGGTLEELLEYIGVHNNKIVQ